MGDGIGEREGGREGGNSGKLDAGGMGLVQQIA